MSAPTVLVVDDDDTVSEVVVDYLRRDGIDATSTRDGRTALALVASHRPDVVVLDRMLPGLDGTEVLTALRAHGSRPAVLMLTALGEEDDRVLGLELGADDYVTKPFSPRELVLRVQALLRRGAPAEPSSREVVVDGDLRLDPVARRATRGEDELALTGRELDLLAFLLRHPGTAYTREDLLREVWGWQIGDLGTVTVHVRRLRRKVEPDPANPVRLVTVWGVGYRWDPVAT